MFPPTSLPLSQSLCDCCRRSCGCNPPPKRIVPTGTFLATSSENGVVAGLDANCDDEGSLGGSATASLVTRHSSHPTRRNRQQSEARFEVHGLDDQDIDSRCPHK